MKKIYFLLVSFHFLTGLYGQQIKNGTEDLHGVEFSRHYGVLSKLNAFPQVKNTLLERKPLWKANTATSAQRNLFAKNSNDADYGFNATISNGVNIPFESITDSQGNTYITGGSSSGTSAEGNFVTVKIDASGSKAWEKRKIGTAFAVEFGMAIALTPAGDPVASGIHWNGNNMDINTIKYDATTGNVLWQQNFNGAANGLDVPTAIATDGSGNIFIAGITYTGTSVRYVVLKYDASGGLVWSSTDDTPVEDVWDEPTAIVVGADGKIAVTGAGTNEEYWQTFYTVVYNAQGGKLWDASYTSQEPVDIENPGSSLSDTNSMANALAFDELGNLYVTGSLYISWGTMGTIKYDSSGAGLWLATHKSGDDHTTAEGICITGDLIYVGGAHLGSYSDDGLVLISYDTAGNESWVQETATLIEPKHPGLFLDAQNRPVVFGSGYDPESSDIRIKAIKYDSNGTVLKETSYLQPYSELERFDTLLAVSFDTSENAYLSMGKEYTVQGLVFETVKLPSGEGSPVPLWDTVYSGSANSNKIMLCTAGDSSSNAFVGGYYGTIDNAAYTVNYFIAKYNDLGQVAWEKIFNPQNGNDNNGIKLTVTSTGEVVVYLMPFDYGASPLRIKKYSNDGNLIWEFEKNVIDAQLGALFTDNDGNIFVAGSSRENENDANLKFTIVKIAASGSELWTTYTPAGQDDNIISVNSGIADPDGNAILTGASGVGSFFSEEVNAAVIKYAPDGTLAWLHSIVIPGQNSSGDDLLADNGAIYVNGAIENADTHQEQLMVCRLDGTGQEQWTSFHGDGERNIRSYTMKKLPAGGLVVSAYSVIYSYNNKVISIALDAAGNEEWVRETPLDRFYRDMHVDAAGNVYLLTQIYGSTFPNRIFYAAGDFYSGEVFKIDTSGTTEAEPFIGPQLSSFDPCGFISLTNGKLLIPGTLENENFFFQGLYFFQTTQEVLGVGENEQLPQARNWLGQNYPNPVPSATQIPFYLEQSGKATIRLYDDTGRYIKTLADDNFAQGSNTIEADLSGIQSGIYFYRIMANRFAFTRKLIVK